MSAMNPGIDYETCFSTWFERGLSVNGPAVCDTVRNLTRRGRDEATQISQLLLAVKCIDLTTLCGDDACLNVTRMCHKAVKPIDKDILRQLNVDPSELSCAAVCVYPLHVATCIKTFARLGSSVPVASVAAGFPSGQYPLHTRLEEIRSVVADGAKEVDVVIRRDLVICGEWRNLYDEVKAMREAAGSATMKTILAAGELGSLTNVYKASLICMAAGSDFLKTSTGKEEVNATLPIGMTMARAIASYHEETDFLVGLKPAGGIRKWQDALRWEELVIRVLGESWLNPYLFRIGATGLLRDIEEHVTQYVTKEHGKPALPYM